MNDQTCPCGSGTAVSVCCLPYINGMENAPTAEALMRSRFTAYCQGNADYLLRTHHPDAHSANEMAEIQKSIAATEWLNLTIIGTSKGSANDAEGHVQFVAAFRKKSLSMLTIAPATTTETGQMHERSFFIRENGRWFYVDGDQLPPYQSPRNALCWCGSEKKTKQCHAGRSTKS